MTNDNVYFTLSIKLILYSTSQEIGILSLKWNPPVEFAVLLDPKDCFFLEKHKDFCKKLNRCQHYRQYLWSIFTMYLFQMAYINKGATQVPTRHWVVSLSMVGTWGRRQILIHQIWIVWSVSECAVSDIKGHLFFMCLSIITTFAIHLQKAHIDYLWLMIHDPFLF